MTFLALLAMAIGVMLALALGLVGLVETPWPILLVGLLVAFYSLQRLLGDVSDLEPSSKAEAKLANFKAEDVVAFPATAPTAPQLARATSPEAGEEDQPSSTAPLKPGEELTYRGIRYRVTQPKPAQTSPTETSGPETSVTEGIYRGQRWRR